MASEITFSSNRRTTENDGHKRPRIILSQHRSLDCLALSALLLSTPEVDLVDTSVSLHALTESCRKHRPDIAIVDAMYPDSVAFDVAENLLENRYVRKVLFLDDRVCASHVKQALMIPNSEYITKENSFESLQEAINKLI